MILDCDRMTVREVNAALRSLADSNEPVTVVSPRGRHNIAVGLSAPLTLTVDGNAGYYLGGLCGQAPAGDSGSAPAGPDITVNGFVGWGVGENLMGGTIRVRGSASQSAGSSARGGTLVIEGDASLRAGISLKGGEILIAGDTGAMSGFMAQAGTILVGGDAGAGLGDSLYEAVIYVAGHIESLGADARIIDLEESDVLEVKRLAEVAGFDHISAGDVKKVASARTLYHFSTHNHGEY